jgi:PPOX class probable F420-dependent enzyme
VTDTRPATGIPEHLRAFLAEPHYATISTIDPDGAPRQAVIWFTLAGDDLVINSLVGRRWPTNLLRDPRVAIAVTDRHDGLRWVGVRGQAIPVRDQPTAQADIAGMARRYHADDPGHAEDLIRDRFATQERISFRIAVAAVHEHLD